MEPFRSLRAIAAPYYEPNVDTDKLIPHRFLRKPLSAGYRNFLFYNERFAPDGSERPEFVLNRESYRRAGILVSGPNFGCGSTREGAVYSLADFGIRAVIAPSFGDIFFANFLQNGLLPVVLPEDACEALARHLEQHPGAEVAIDLPAQTVTGPDGRVHRFDIEPSRKEKLLKGQDDISLTLEYRMRIDEFERQYRARLPWLAPQDQKRNIE
jgi:3-isopropylmalate/(R)-2-methylmalate dehydratase small subunit